ncbi:hypothetical protein PC116_g20107 [Phytophthora cactorum]|uniref:Uncharacterized protein n=1 Tax=Phytophthora cactorum TaxID=29920 RepID=A0A8T1KBR6_9STRA|nr:hypothetical protein PC114_g22427 [Phytophthora cactorum]KAG2926715.1 hypothetical protein PC117_g14782 [Phytophthora cactorum]KAG2978154.1 hypothetical protein PC119_g21810 [Phytophthora cactorum]KAG3012242.1 hypothetical protein PC120_g13980 [Phytophthora cactorum]KAG3152739.1 hypothetical protein PC128_g22706 [Phytophthora cactorum]
MYKAPVVDVLKTKSAAKHLSPRLRRLYECKFFGFTQLLANSPLPSCLSSPPPPRYFLFQ